MKHAIAVGFVAILGVNVPMLNQDPSKTIMTQVESLESTRHKLYRDLELSGYSKEYILRLKVGYIVKHNENCLLNTSLSDDEKKHCSLGILVKHVTTMNELNNSLAQAQ